MSVRRLLRHQMLAVFASLLVTACNGDTPSGQRLNLDTFSSQLGVQLNYMDQNVRPQDDLYRFVNGRWLAAVEVPADGSSYGAFEELASRADLQLSDIIRRIVAAPEESLDANQRRIRNLYLSLADAERAETLGLTPLDGIREKIAALQDKTGLAGLFAEFQVMGLTAPLQFLVLPDNFDTSIHAGYLDQSGLGLPNRGYYFPEDAAGDAPEEATTEALLGDYETHIARMLGLAGAGNQASRAKGVLALETRLARGHVGPAFLRDRGKMYNPASPADIARMAPNQDWGEYFAALGVAAPARLILRQPDYLGALNGALEDFSLEVWRDYLTFHLLDDMADVLPAAVREARFDFYQRRLRGVQKPRPRDRRAATLVNRILGDALGPYYVAEHFSPRSRARVGRMVGNIRAAFAGRIRALEWMGPETRAMALQKLAALTVKVGYPEVWRSYEGLEMRADDAAGNLLRAGRADWRRITGKLGKPVDRREWMVSPQLVNAFYNAATNEIVFPAGILQPPFFDPQAEEAVNYGAIGAVIGHEISHAFDDQGRKSDGRGNLRDWWQPADAQEFERRARALVRQYETYEPVAGLALDGRLTLGENIGDRGGLLAAYDAYRISLKGRRSLRIMNFSGEQRFFIGWAQIWRRVYTADDLRRRLLNDSHPPGEYRVNGSVANLAAFHDAFQVIEGDRLYLPPGERVTIW